MVATMSILTIPERARASIREWIDADKAQARNARYEAQLSKSNHEAQERIDELEEQACFFDERLKLLEAALEVTAPSRVSTTSARPAQPQAQQPQKRLN